MIVFFFIDINGVLIQNIYMYELNYYDKSQFYYILNYITVAIMCPLRILD